MKTNEIINNEEVIDVTEEIVNSGSKIDSKKVGAMGLGIIVGLTAVAATRFAGKYIVNPAWERFKEWKEKRKAIAGTDGLEITDFEIEDVTSEE